MSAKKLVVSTYLQYVVIGAVFAVPIVAIIAAVFRYLRGTLLFERWHKAPVFALDDGGKSSPGTGGKEL